MPKLPPAHIRKYQHSLFTCRLPISTCEPVLFALNFYFHVRAVPEGAASQCIVSSAQFACVNYMIIIFFPRAASVI